MTKTVEDYTDGTPTATTNKTTSYTYDGNNNVTAMMVSLPGGGGETTGWVYGVTTAGGSGVNSNDILAATQYPDPTTGAASSSQQDTYTVNALGETVTSTDRNGSVHTYTYDVLGRVTADAVTTLGSGVDGTVRRIEYAYDTQGNPYLVTSYDASSGGSVVNQVQQTFNGLGQLTTEYQSHSGSVNTTSTPSVQYAYLEMSGGANNSRQTSMTYPNGKVLTYNYASGLASNISRLSSLSDSTGTVESYDYLGLDTVVRRAHPQLGVDLTYIKQTGESNGDAGDQYTGLDRFGRITDQRWINTSTSTATDQFFYGYDRDSNPTYRDNAVNAAFGEVYTYDNLGQLSSFTRGTLNSTKTGITGTASRSQTWSYDALGNWSSLTTDGTNVSRTNNMQNEVTAVGSTSLSFDANGNLTADQAGQQYVYDAWNRLLKVKNSSGTTIAEYRYDGLGRRVSETRSGTTTDLYYSSDWQVLEERLSGSTTAQYIWSPVYMDALILRDRDTDGNGSLDERLWVQQDADWNVTALVNGSGVVVERYMYDPFGSVTVLDGSWSIRSGGSSYSWTYLYQGLRLDPATGIYNARNRDIHPGLGRALQRDPLGYGGGDVNVYRWEGNTPPNGVDPTGEIFALLKSMWAVGDKRWLAYHAAVIANSESDENGDKKFRLSSEDEDYYRIYGMGGLEREEVPKAVANATLDTMEQIGEAVAIDAISQYVPGMGLLLAKFAARGWKFFVQGGTSP